MKGLRVVALACSICFSCVVGFSSAFSGEAAPATPSALGTPIAAPGCDGAAPWWKATSERARALLDAADNMDALSDGKCISAAARTAHLRKGGAIMRIAPRLRLTHRDPAGLFAVPA